MKGSRLGTSKGCNFCKRKEKVTAQPTIEIRLRHKIVPTFTSVSKKIQKK